MSASSVQRRRLGVGLIGLGRLGRVYARDLSTRIAETRLVAVADLSSGLAAEVAEEFDVPAAYESPHDLIADAKVDAIVVASPTHTHRDVVLAAVAGGKPTFCEKPLALSLGSAGRCRLPWLVTAPSSRWGSCDGSIRATLQASGRSTMDESGRPWCSRRLRATRTGRASSMRTQPAAAAFSWTWVSTTSTWRAGSWATSRRSRQSAGRSPIPDWRR